MKLGGEIVVKSRMVEMIDLAMECEERVAGRNESG